VAAVGSPTLELLRSARIEEDALEPAVAAHVIELANGVVRFTHPLLAAGVYQGLSAAERRRTHRRVSEIVEDPVARARHLALGSDGPDARVAAFVEHVAAVGTFRRAPTVASELAGLARQLTPVDDREDLHRRRILAAHAQLIAGDVSGARALASELLEQTPPGPARAEAIVLLSGIAARGEGDHERAVALRREALREPGVHPALQAAIHQWLGANVRGSEGLRAAERHARASVALAERIGDDALRAAGLAILGSLHCALGEPDALGLAEDAHTLATAIAATPREEPASVGLAHLLAWSINRLDRIAAFCLAEVLADSGRIDTARSLRENLYRELAESDELAAAHVLLYLGDLEFEAGRWRLGADYIGRVQEVRLEYGYEPEDPEMSLFTAVVALCRGDLEHAREIAKRGRDSAEGFAEILASLEAILGLADHWGGDSSAAFRRFEAAERVARSVDWVAPGTYWWRGDFAEAMIELGLIDEAVSLVDAWEADATRLGRERVPAHATRCRGLVAAARGDIDGAQSLLEQAIADHEAVGDPVGQARALLAIGVVRRRARQKRAARDAIEQAHAAFDEVGAPGWAEKARAELGRLGGRRREPGLTPAEQRVAAQVAEGRTNREVAAALFLGERTVETHLSHIYAKLGVRSRTELARQLQAAP